MAPQRLVKKSFDATAAKRPDLAVMDNALPACEENADVYRGRAEQARLAAKEPWIRATDKYSRNSPLHTWN